MKKLLFIVSGIKYFKNLYYKGSEIRTLGSTRSAKDAFLKTIHFKSRGPKFGPLLQ